MITRYLARSASYSFPVSDVITTFGPAALVRCRDGQVELHGGGRRERIEAREWISLFRPELVLKAQEAASDCSVAVGDSDPFQPQQSPGRCPLH